VSNIRLSALFLFAAAAILSSSCRSVSRSVNDAIKHHVTTRSISELTAIAQDSIVPEGAKLELVWGEGKFTEGPAAAPDGSILFTDIPNERILRYFPDRNKTYVFREQSGRANGLALDYDGMLIACEGGGRRLIKLTADNELQVLADDYLNKKFNSPNDLVFHPAGWIYFTDPRYGNKGPARELDYEGVFLYRRGYVTLASTEVTRPNGIVISRDGKYAYVADNKGGEDGVRQLSRFRIRKRGNLADKKVMIELADFDRGIDGMTMDKSGNIYATAGKGDNAGVYVFSPNGRLLAKIPVPDVPTNCTFGGRKAPNILYVTAKVPATGKFGLYRIKLKSEGIPD
jgi:gluconolactonase